MALTNVSRPAAFPRALVWLFTCVKAVVCLQVALLVESLTATLKGALEVGLLVVFLHVGRHITYLIICLVTPRYRTCKLCLVDLKMGLEPCLVWELFATTRLGASELSELFDVVLGVLE